MKKIIKTENAPAAIGPYSQAVMANGMLYMSGQIALIPETGDYVEIKNKSVYLNGQALEEKYLDAGTVTDSAEGFFLDVVVPDGYVYVLGDNREVSGDSRRFGCIPIDKIEGKAVFRFWPLNKLGKVK